MTDRPGPDAASEPTGGEIVREASDSSAPERGRPADESIARRRPQIWLMLCAFLLVLIGMGFADQPMPYLLGVGLGLLAVMVGVIGLYFVVKVKLSPVRRLWTAAPSSPGAYDVSRYERFEDVVASFSMAAGVDPPGLIVMDLPSPNMYLFYLSGSIVIAVTPMLLELELSDQQSEAILAAGVVKAVLDSLLRTPVSSQSDYWKQAEQMVDTYCSGYRPRPIAPGALHPGTDTLAADTIAARMTHDPTALKEAILIVESQVRDNPWYPVVVSEPWGLFVNPPIGRTRSSTYKQYVNRLQERIENLERIAQGERLPHHEILDGRQTLVPEAWE